MVAIFFVTRLAKWRYLASLAFRTFSALTLRRIEPFVRLYSLVSQAALRFVTSMGSAWVPRPAKSQCLAP